MLRKWKKAVRTVLLICEVKERVESSITPKLLTREEMGTRQPSMLILMGGDLECRFGTNKKNFTFIAVEFEFVLCHPRCNGL